MGILEDYINIILSELVTKNRILEFLVSLEHLKEINYMSKDISYFREFDNTDKEYSGLLTKGLELYSFEKDRELCATLVDTLREALTGIKDINMTLAIKPSVEFLSSIHNLLFKYLNERFCIDIKVDPNIIGGVQLSYNGNYLDMSLNKKLDDYFKANKENVLSRI